jgi:hypothetical protein
MGQKRSSPYTKSELNKRAEQFRGTQENRVHEFRLKKHTAAEKKSTKTDWWDMPLTVCSCGTRISPYVAANGRNCSVLKNPHKVLVAAYNNILDNNERIIGSIKLGTHPDKTIKTKLGLAGGKSWEAGRCAEPHAANRLLSRSKTVTRVSDILFSNALDSRYPISKSYCVTCKCVFPQLR